MWKSTHVIWILAALAAVHLSATALAASGIQEYSKATRYYRGLDRPDRVLLRFETAPDAFANSVIPTEKFLRKNPALTLAGAGTHQEAPAGFVKLPDALVSEDFTRTYVKLNKMLNPFPALYAPEGGP